MTVDPISEDFAFISGYNYAENSPVANTDLWGLQARPINVARPNLRVVHRANGRASTTRSNPNFNPNNPSALSLPVIQSNNANRSSNTSGGPNAAISGEQGPVSTDPVMAQIRENNAQNLTNSIENDDERRFNELLERQMNGGMLTEAEQEFLHERATRRVHRGNSSSEEPQEVYEVFDEVVGEVVYIGLGFEGSGRPNQSLKNAQNHPSMQGRKLGVRVVERPKNRAEGFQRESARIKTFVRTNKQLPELQGVLYAN